MTYHLHVGVDAINLHTATGKIRGVRPRYVEGDGWNCWGEALGNDINNHRTLHVVIEVATEHDATDLIANLAGAGVLEPMSGYEQQNGVVAVLSDTSDWGSFNGEEPALSWRDGEPVSPAKEA